MSEELVWWWVCGLCGGERYGDQVCPCTMYKKDEESGEPDAPVVWYSQEK